MNPIELRARTRSFALRVVKLVQALPKGHVADVLGKQVLRSATSVGANYRAACRAQTKPVFLLVTDVYPQPILAGYSSSPASKTPEPDGSG